MKPTSGRTSNRIAADARRLIRFLSARRRQLSPLIILTHDYPDPDSIASAATLKYLAKKMFKIESEVTYGGVIGRTENREMVARLRLPLRPLRAGELDRAKHVALVDTQPAFKNNRFPADRRATIVIDQHRSVKKPDADLGIINLECGATSVILAQALFAAKCVPPPEIATALVYGILTDTLHFFRSAEAAVINTYLRLLPQCDLPNLAKIQNPRRSARFFATLERAIAVAVCCRDILVSHLGDVDNPDLVSQIADLLVTADGVRWCLLTGRHRGRLFMSLRSSTPNVEAGELLRDICGDRASAGGHGGIAGGSFSVGPSAPESTWRAEENALFVRLLERLDVPARFPVKFPFRLSDGRR